ncbi:hypothetical protein [Parapedobacter soli]|uniref:hypothetical protein n=1 Tax=Parapedobacter soli TaxID=416955 RepID=UPI0021C734D1|nr:hypothetical protein [Parapedobacter soli]
MDAPLVKFRISKGTAFLFGFITLKFLLQSVLVNPTYASESPSVGIRACAATQFAREQGTVVFVFVGAKIDINRRIAEELTARE